MVGAVPTMVGVVPPMVGVVPTMVGAVPTMVGAVPTMLGAVPTMLGVVPTMVGVVRVASGLSFIQASPPHSDTQSYLMERYEVGLRIGKGGYGSVYKVHHTPTHPTLSTPSC